MISWLVALGFGLATVLGWIALPHSTSVDPSILVLLWFNILVMLSALGVELGRRPYSLHVMHLVSMYLFLGAAALFQYTRGQLAVPGSIALLKREMLPTVASITFWLAGYITAYEFRPYVSRRPSMGGLLSRSLTTSRVIVLSLMACVGLAYLAAVGLLGATTRGAADEAIGNFSAESGAGAYSGTIGILTTNVARALPPVSLLTAVLLLVRDRRRRHASLSVLVAIVGLGTLLVNNPFAAARMFFTCNVIAFSAPFALLRFKTAWPLVLAITFGLTILPALGNARGAVRFDELVTYLQVISPLQYLSTNGDVDSLGMTALCQRWIDQFGYTWGRQFLGAMLFWIPRAIWTTKPIGTGTMVAQDLGFEYANLAPPIPAEGLINFGLPGVFVFGAIFGWILSYMDAVYWRPGRNAIAKSFRIIDAIYPFLLVCVVYYTRGDLFPAMAFMVSFTIWILPLGIGVSRRSFPESPVMGPAP